MHASPGKLSIVPQVLHSLTNVLESSKTHAMNLLCHPAILQVLIRARKTKYVHLAQVGQGMVAKFEGSLRRLSLSHVLQHAHKIGDRARAVLDGRDGHLKPKAHYIFRNLQPNPKPQKTHFYAPT